MRIANPLATDLMATHSRIAQEGKNYVPEVAPGSIVINHVPNGEPILFLGGGMNGQIREMPSHHQMLTTTERVIETLDDEEDEDSPPVELPTLEYLDCPVRSVIYFKRAFLYAGATVHAFVHESLVSDEEVLSAYTRSLKVNFVEGRD